MSKKIFNKSKKQSKDARKRMEHMMYIAKENPEKIYDLSACEVINVPSGVFAMCKVLLKESLLLHTNLLKNLKQSGKVSDLMSLRILDLHNNRLTELPEEICTLKNLQVLNVENNAISTLPRNIGELTNLQTLNARENKLNCIPSSIEKAKSLRTLDVSGSNKIFYLPKTLCKVKTLETLVLSNPSLMEYPPPFVAEMGLEEMMKFICRDSGEEYVPPSHSLLPVLGTQESNTVVDGPDSSGIQFDNSIMVYEKMKDEKRKQHLELEKHLAETQMEQAMLATMSQNNRAQDLDEITKKQEIFDKSVLKQQEQQDNDRKRMLKMLVTAEKSALSLADDLLKINEKSRKKEALFEKMEQQRMKEEEYFKITQEDLDNLRKKEILSAIQEMLMEDARCSIKVKQYLAEQGQAIKKAQGSIQYDDKQMEQILRKQQETQDNLIGEIMYEEDMQRQAFLTLQYEKDIAHRRIVSQIGKIENALANLTLVEMKRNQYKMDNEQEVHRLKREELTDLLMVLLKEKDDREVMLKDRLVELENQKENDQLDFWLVQFQKLLDSKPEKLVFRESVMDVAVLKLLSKANAEDHVSSFARNMVLTMNDLIELSDEDLRRIGVHELAVRRNILRLIEEEMARSKKLDDYEVGPTPQTSTIEITTPYEQTPDTPTGELLTEDNECTVCMEKQSNTVFLPCGHVCACNDCSLKLHVCPMCRTDICQKIQIFRS